MYIQLVVSIDILENLSHILHWGKENLGSTKNASEVQRASHTQGISFRDMRVDHRGLKV